MSIIVHRPNSLETFYEKNNGEVLLVFSGVGDDNSFIHLGKYDEYGDFESTEELFSGWVDWDGGYETEESYTPEDFHEKVVEFTEQYGFE